MRALADITGQRFGRLIAIKFVGIVKGKTIWQFLCDGMARNGKDHPIYNSWRSMKRRCSNPNAANYRYYGGCGVRVCERWQKFENFLEDMGPTWEKGLSIHRIDPNGNYEAGNCIWATDEEQRNNRRDSK